MYVRWGEFTGTVSGSINLTSGIDPDVFSVGAMVPGKKQAATIAAAGDVAIVSGQAEQEIIPRQADLIISDGRNELTFFNCRAAEGSIQINSTSQSAGLMIRDRRWAWLKAEPILGEYNRRDDKGNIIDTANQVSAHDLAVKLLDKLGEKDYKISGLPTDEYPYVDWEYAATADELADLCNQYSCVVCLGVDNVAKIHAIGQGAEIPGEPRKDTSVVKQIIDKPATVRFVGGRNKYQIEIPLTAVGYNPRFWLPAIQNYEGDAKYYPIDDNELPYKPFTWDGVDQDFQWYPGFVNNITGTDITAEEYRKAANDTVFRAYRLPESFVFVLESQAETPGGGAAQTITITREYTRAQLMANWSDELVETELVGDEDKEEERRRPPYCKGIHKTEAYFTDPIAEGAFEYSIVPVDFEIDKEYGIIIFSEEVFDTYPDDTEEGIQTRMQSAELQLVCSFDMDLFFPDFNEDGDIKTLTRGGVKDITETVRRDDVFYEYIERDPTAEELAAQTAGKEQAFLVLQNKDETDAWAKYHIIAQYGQYAHDIIEAAVNSYSGIRTEFEPDGAIDQVSWVLGPQGPITTVSWGAEQLNTIPKKIRDRDIDIVQIIRDWREKKRSNLDRKVKKK